MAPLVKMLKKRSYLPLFILLASPGIIACGKDKNPFKANPKPKVELAGEWKWVSSRGGWGGDIIEPSVDSVVTLRFGADSSYSVKLNNQLKFSGYFSSVTLPLMDSLIVLSFDTNIRVHRMRIQRSESIVYFAHDTCTLYDSNMSDGYSHIFKKNP